ncbi:diacylglycerol/lipid kinase family protein [Yinghuangia seranimata]|uniref:diacylglycerol/lipid kinase family protein n=1 Tax=Yinghuangia seranimata TaxID=408067 RepID=UPI00248BB145|nr:diacylglycerol kinase family protein [Yinghuangia seranimata]MDI2128089.1 diacylglycerol kinase family lipid kinase [Yinghuangia seranimata]
MRALLVVNPKATTTSERTRDVLAHALASDLKLDVAVTGHRGHATELARAAVADGVDVVIALGGDGTVNEVANGVLADGPSPDLPAVAVVPGGSTNVFARALGMPNDPVEATGVLLDALRTRRTREIGLGMADDRWFLFCAGFGFDAEVVARVEEHRADGKRSTSALYVRSALRRFYRSGGTRRSGPLTLEVPGREPVPGLCLGIVQNTNPWTYLGARPVTACPDASFDTGLDLFGLTRMSTLPTLRHLSRMLGSSGNAPHGRHVVSLHDCATFTLGAEEAVSLQVDGDHLGEHRSVTFRGVPRALRVIV